MQVSTYNKGSYRLALRIIGKDTIRNPSRDHFS